MKNLFKLPALVLGLVLLLSGLTLKAQAQDDDISLQTFYDELSPYGTWIQDQEYGYVWRPDVDQSDFRPYYSNGRWAMTEYGNTWVSDYDWGWAPFHYGRWIQSRYNEWLWVPDTVWGPAWVSWRSGGGYYGWAPLTPGFNININFGGGYHIPNSYWCFIPQSNIYYNNFPRYRSYRNVTIIRNTTIINYTGQRNRNNYFTGPRRDEIRRATNQDVRVYNVNRSARSGRSSIANNTVNIYNPRNNRSVDNKNAVPRSIVKADEYNAGRNSRGNRANNNNQSVVGTRTGRQQDAQGTRSDATPRTERTQNATRNRDAQTDVQRQQAEAQRAERSRQQQARGEQSSQTERSSRSREQQVQQQEQTQRAARSREQQVQAQQQQEQTQRAERSRQQQVQVQQQQQQRQQEQQQRQERSRQQETQRTQQAQPQRQERVQQSVPRNENRGGGESQGSGRSSRSSRG